MNPTPELRVAISRLIIITAMLCGATAGCLLGCGLALMQTTSWLDRYAKLAAAQENASLAEAHSLLNFLKGSRYPSCSDAEIVEFRELVFRSEYLKDVGRIRGGKIDCSATVGRPVRPIGTFKPLSRQADGTIAYTDLSPIQDSSLKREALQLGSAYGVFGPNPPPNLEPVPMHLTMTMKGDVDPQGAPAASGAGDGQHTYLSTDGTGHMDDMLYATRCSALHFNCITAFTSVHEALHGQGDILLSGAVAGGLAGILIGMLFSFLRSRSRDLAQQLRRAVDQDELQVLYQPIVNLETEQVVGAEALARWTDEDGNEITPDVFVKLAEERGFVGEITKAVLQRILRDFAKTLHNRPGFRVSINVAAADLADPAFLPMLQESLRRAKVGPQSLVLEITERSASNSEAAMETIRNLRRIGHSIHIDDFGTGYSNLDKLLYLFADTIKIDKAFTGLIGSESVSAAILPQILKMAKSLNLEVVVEGVETTQQADYFSPGEQKIYAQGWLYGRPVTAEGLLSILADNRPRVLATPDKAAAFTTKPGALRIVSAAAA